MTVRTGAHVIESHTGSRLFSTEAMLAFAPGVTFATLLADPRPLLWRRAGMAVLVVATAIPIMAVQRVTIGLAVVTALSWSFVLVIQAVVGAGLIASARSRRIAMTRALDLWFAGHLPYSLWILAVTASLANLPAGSPDLLIASAVVPATWTAVIVAAFCRVVLGTTHAGARWRAAFHFVVVWAITLEYVAWSAGGWFQITDSIARVFE